MKNLLPILLICHLLITASAQDNQPREILFDRDWKFHRGGILGAERPDFDDSHWRTVHLPHDWSIEDLPGTDSPFTPTAIGQASSGFTVGGTGFYRKRFTLEAAHQDKTILIRFDGVYMNSEVYLNGRRIGQHPYGYSAFWFDITRHVRFGEENVLTVKVMNEGANSRWYSGSGIYRHVWLSVINRVHIGQWGVSVTTPVIDKEKATIVVRTDVENTWEQEQQIKLVSILLDPDGKEVARTESGQRISGDDGQVFRQEISISNPRLWSLETPLRYTVISQVYAGNQLVDETPTKFGIRTISFSTNNGFQLNGKTIKLKGGCIHHDNGPLGAKAFDRAEERKIELLKASGFNAIRSAHNPASPALLEACDRLGMLVIDEAFDMWQEGKNPYDYHLWFNDWWKKDIETMILRGRNHPSIILWSIGNEIPNMDNPATALLAAEMAAYCRELDPTRPVTAAVNSVTNAKDPFFSALGVAGYNYANIKYRGDHERHPDRVMVATESMALFAFDYWMDVLDHAWVIGDFVWTAFDYIGEASIGWRGYDQDEHLYPWTLAYCGDIDICGWKRPQSYYRDVLWNKQPTVALAVKPPVPSFPLNDRRQSWSNWHWHDAVRHWNFEGFEGKELEVSVYANTPVVELFLNGKSLGKKNTNRSNQFIATWKVKYRPGELKVVGIQGKKRVSESLYTAGAVEKIMLHADRTELKADGQDLAYITVELQDGRGHRNVKAEHALQFSLAGPGEIIAVGNANPVSTESYTQPKRKAWQGRCLVIVRTSQQSADLKLTVTSIGLPAAELMLRAR